jgi:tetrahydromethanopterin S-methyltransferase subunit F
MNYLIITNDNPTIGLKTTLEDVLYHLGVFGRKDELGDKTLSISFDAAFKYHNIITNLKNFTFVIPKIELFTIFLNEKGLSIHDYVKDLRYTENLENNVSSGTQFNLKERIASRMKEMNNSSKSSADNFLINETEEDTPEDLDVPDSTDEDDLEF